MRLCIKFGDREFSFEDSSPTDMDDVLALGNMARALLLQAAVPADEEDEPEIAELESRKSIGFGPAKDDDEDDE